MRSLKQIQASRANGARSRGPITAQGKRNSSRNSTRHGFSAPDPSLDYDPPAAFLDLRTGFIADLRPRDAVEVRLVHTMAVAHWRKFKVIQAQTLFLNRAQTLETASEHHALLRYEIAFDLKFARALRLLLSLQSRESARNRLAERTQQHVDLNQHR
jgi:hypothetical protein